MPSHTREWLNCILSVEARSALEILDMVQEPCSIYEISKATGWNANIIRSMIEALAQGGCALGIAEDIIFSISALEDVA
ncbi:MAG TPA: hypothetical protein DDW51_05650 [Cyanobacteria bacterium UBA11367]|nr:hypothetical protein [Cyanobacteria bacterium UBA11367]